MRKILREQTAYFDTIFARQDGSLVDYSALK
jgi:hypothetical protein